MAKPRTPRRMKQRRPFWQKTSRPVPGTVFCVHKAKNVYSKKWMQVLHALAEKGGLPVLFRVPKKLAEKHKMPGRTTGKLWFSPLRRVSAQNIGEHDRTVFARVGDGFITFKGSGKSGSTRSYPLTNPHIPFSFPSGYLGGGMIYDVALREAAIAEAINRAFVKMKKRGDEVARSANVAPTFEPIAILEPLQIPVETVWEDGRRGAEKQEQRRAMREAGVPEEIAKEQAVLVSHCKTPYRIRDFEWVPGNLLIEFLKIGRAEKRVETAAEHIINAFEVHGYKLGLENGKVEIRRKHGRGWQKTTFEEARRGILDGFIQNFGSSIRVVHKELKGAFQADGLTSLDRKDVTLAGQIMDLDVVQPNIRDSRARVKLQEEDREHAKTVLNNFIDAFFPDITKRELLLLQRDAWAKLERIIS